MAEKKQNNNKKAIAGKALPARHEDVLVRQPAHALYVCRVVGEDGHALVVPLGLVVLPETRQDKETYINLKRPSYALKCSVRTSEALLREGKRLKESHKESKVSLRQAGQEANTHTCAC